MKLTHNQIEQVAKWLNEKWEGAKQCPICRNNNWTISDTVFEVREFHSGDLIVGGPVVPMILVVCNVCGHTLTFNALKVGVVRAPKGVKDEDAQVKPLASSVCCRSVRSR